jgi:FixJ family two-component response regulator
VDPSPRLNGVPKCDAYRLTELESSEDGWIMAPFVAIIDDDVGIRNALHTLMRSASYRAEAFASAEAFVASTEPPDCIITDISMRGMSGLELADFIRSKGCCVPIIMISALPDEDLARKAIGVGARCLLRKPIESNALISLVEESIASHPPKPCPPAHAGHLL